MKIFLIDYHVLFREGLSSLLENSLDLEVVGQTGILSKAVEMVSETRPDLVLMDIDPFLDEGLEVIYEILSWLPDTKIILLTNQDSDEIFEKTLRLGVKGYINKNSSFDDVLASIHGVERGEAALSRKMTGKALDLLFGVNRESIEPGDGLACLTPRELEVMKCLSKGASNRSIAKELVISENTVKIHVHNILDKLALKNRREVTRYAQQHNIDILIPKA